MKKFLTIAALLFFLVGLVAAEANQYFFVSAAGLDKKTNKLYYFVSDIISVKSVDGNLYSGKRNSSALDLSLKNQFFSWLRAYAKEASGAEFLNLNLKIVVSGSYGSRGEAVLDKRKYLGSLGPTYISIDLPRTSLPAFRDEEYAE